MPIKRKLAGPGGVQFEVVYFPELIAGGANINGRLPSDEYAHALWWYYILATSALKKAKDCMVYEKDLSPKFDVPKARKLLESVAFQYGAKPSELTRYWEAVEQQRIALGFDENAALPHSMRFRWN